MKIVSILIAFSIVCLTELNYCYKFHDVDLIPERFLRRADFLSNNRQKSLYHDAEQQLHNNYQETLKAIAAQGLLNAASLNQNNRLVVPEQEDDENSAGVYSEELHLDDFIYNNDDDEDENENDEDAREALLRLSPKYEETESHSSLIAGHQYVSGGAGEGKQHLHPDGAFNNKDEVKTDEDLPAYCDPPNPCPVGYQGDDCDARPYIEFTAEYSKFYQEQQNCMCDDDHNDCQKSSSLSAKAKSVEKMNELLQMGSDKKFPQIVAKKSPRVRRSLELKNKHKKNPFTQGKAIKIHVAKKSSPQK